MNKAEHEKRIDWLFGRITDYLDETYRGKRSKEVRDLIDDALADAYGSGEVDERKRVTVFLKDQETGPTPDSCYANVPGRKVRQLVLETAREFIEEGRHDLTPVSPTPEG